MGLCDLLFLNVIGIGKVGIVTYALGLVWLGLLKVLCSVLFLTN
jgi:hypothetical protein